MCKVSPPKTGMTLGLLGFNAITLAKQ